MIKYWPIVLLLLLVLCTDGEGPTPVSALQQAEVCTDTVIFYDTVPVTVFDTMCVGGPPTGGGPLYIIIEGDTFQITCQDSPFCLPFDPGGG